MIIIKFYRSLKIFFSLPMKLTFFTPLSIIISPVTPPLSPIIKHNHLADPPLPLPWLRNIWTTPNRNGSSFRNNRFALYFRNIKILNRNNGKILLSNQTIFPLDPCFVLMIPNWNNWILFTLRIRITPLFQE